MILHSGLTFHIYYGLAGIGVNMRVILFHFNNLVCTISLKEHGSNHSTGTSVVILNRFLTKTRSRDINVHVRFVKQSSDMF